jgi:hypothetical protein
MTDVQEAAYKRETPLYTYDAAQAEFTPQLWKHNIGTNI